MADAFIQTDATRVFATPGTTSTAQAVGGLTGATAAARVYNGTNQVVAVAFGLLGLTASLANGSMSVPIPPGGVEVFRTPLGVTHAAVVAAAASTGAVYVTPGDGA